MGRILYVFLVFFLVSVYSSDRIKIESSPDEYEDLIEALEGYEKPALPHVAPIEDFYSQIDGSVYEKYSIEKQDVLTDTVDALTNINQDYLSVFVPAIVIGVVSRCRLIHLQCQGHRKILGCYAFQLHIWT